jgi:hypothetical protein
MEELVFKVFGDDGKTKQVSERIIYPDANDPDSSHSLWKLKAFARALGKEAEFEAQKFQAIEQIGQNCRVELKIESSPGFEDKNVIGKFIAPKPGGQNQRAPVMAGTDAPVNEADIPF